ncbi:MAG: hypothetical protein AAF603_00865 [Pseudomonadota bacterium]
MKGFSVKVIAQNAAVLMIAPALLFACVSRDQGQLPIEPQDISPVEAVKEDPLGEGKQQKAVALGGKLLTTQDIEEAFRGRILRGCYPNGESFAQTLVEDGRFYDVNQNNRFMGTWAGRNAQLCFRYEERVQAGEPDVCFAVLKVQNEYDFYTSDLNRKVASTRCS